MSAATDSAAKAHDAFAGARYAPYTRSSADEEAAVLRARFGHEGYLYFPRAIDRDLVDPLRDAIVAALAPQVAWDRGLQSPVLCGEPFAESDALWDRLYPRVQAIEALHALFHAPAAIELMQLVAGPRVFVYPMKMARVASPRRLGCETPPHQDAYSHHAGPTMAGMWIALHDADSAMGRLTLLPGSHQRGVRPVHAAAGVGGVQCEIYADESLWHVGDVAAGDVILFHSRTVHRAQANTDGARVRLSVDTRFCDHGAPVFSTNLEPHHGWRIPGLDWEFVYRDWRSDALKYYWRDYPALF